MAISLNIAFTYDSQTDCLARGWTGEQASAYASTESLNSIKKSLTKLGHQVIDVSHVRNLARRLAADEAREWDLVFNISEGVYGNAKETQIPALLEAYRVPYTFSDAACLAVSADKAKTKMILRHYNIPTSPFITIQTYEISKGSGEVFSSLTTLLKERLEKADLKLSTASPLFIKPTMEGGSNGISYRSRVTSLADLVEIVQDLHRQFPRQPLLIEKYADGREFTVTIIGTADQAKVLGIFEIRKIRRNGTLGDGTLGPTKPSGEDDVDFSSYEVKKVGTVNFFEVVNVTDEASDEVREVGRIALATFKVLDCRDLARIDIRSFGHGSDAKPQILEVNSIPGLRPERSHTARMAEEKGWTHDQLMAEILSETIRRYGGYEGIAAMKKARQKDEEGQENHVNN